MKKTSPIKAAACLIGVLLLTAACGFPGEKLNGELQFQDGAALPMLNWSYYREDTYTNAGSDILRFCVYVETDHDTDNDGLADLVKVFMQVPRTAAEGKYKAAVIYNPTPYGAGYNGAAYSSPEGFYEKVPFDYQSLYRECGKRTPVSSETTLELSEHADPQDWNYQLEGSDSPGFSYSDEEDYFLVRGFAVANACGIGTYGSEGFELCGTDLERDSHKCVVEWLAGERRAFTDKTQNIEIAADWSNGAVAMTGCSYGGAIPFAVAASGVSGLKTIIPYSGIADWYDYTNSQGIPLRYDVHYTDFLASSNCGGSFTDETFTALKPGYGSYLWQTSEDEEETNGDYAPVWEAKMFSDEYANLKCSALIVQGLNDYNVTSRQADLMMQAFEKAGQTAKLVLHQEAHVTLLGRTVNGTLWDELLNKWLCHYLYGVENGIEDMAAVTAQSNVDGSWRTFESWRGFQNSEVRAVSTQGGETSLVSSARVADNYSEVFSGSAGLLDAASAEVYYSSLESPLAAKYRLELPENALICGVPEIHVRLNTQDIEKDGLMITAVLADSADDGSAFNVFAGTELIPDEIGVEAIGQYPVGGGLEPETLSAPVQVSSTSKVVTYGWTDLQNPGCGPDSREYVYQERDLSDSEYYDYTFYMLPTVYTVAPGHHLELILTTWDPYRAILDDEYMMDQERDPKYSFYTYEYTVDNSSLQVLLPLEQK